MITYTSPQNTFKTSRVFDITDVVILIVFIIVGGLFGFAVCRVQKKIQTKQTAGGLHDTRTGIRYRDLNKDEVPLVDDFSDDEFDTR